MDCLGAMEVKAGMDMSKLKKQFGGKISLYGGNGCQDDGGERLQSHSGRIGNKPVHSHGRWRGYIIHSYHGILDQVEYKTYELFVEYGLGLGHYQ